MCRSPVCKQPAARAARVSTCQQPCMPAASVASAVACSSGVRSDMQGCRHCCRGRCRARPNGNLAWRDHDDATERPHLVEHRREARAGAAEVEVVRAERRNLLGRDETVNLRRGAGLADGQVLHQAQRHALSSSARRSRQAPSAQQQHAGGGWSGGCARLQLARVHACLHAQRSVQVLCVHTSCVPWR